MTGDVGERFLDDAINRAFSLGVQPAIVPAVKKLHGYLMPPPKIGDQRLERGDETEIVERGWVKQM
jgi:hypothetical protein